MPLQILIRKKVPHTYILSKTSGATLSFHLFLRPKFYGTFISRKKMALIFSAFSNIRKTFFITLSNNMSLSENWQV